MVLPFSTLVNSVLIQLYCCLFCGVKVIVYYNCVPPFTVLIMHDGSDVNLLNHPAVFSPPLIDSASITTTAYHSFCSSDVLS